MNVHNDVDDRVRRADQRELTYYIKDRFPSRDGVPGEISLIEVDSHHSGDTHAIVPQSTYCSCEDARYRRGPCWHLFYLARDDSVEDEVRHAVRDGILSQSERWLDESQDLLDELEDAREQAEVYGLASAYAFDRPDVGRRVNESTPVSSSSRRHDDDLVEKYDDLVATDDLDTEHEWDETDIEDFKRRFDGEHIDDADETDDVDAGDTDTESDEGDALDVYINSLDESDDPRFD